MKWPLRKVRQPCGSAHPSLAIARHGRRRNSHRCQEYSSTNNHYTLSWCVQVELHAGHRAHKLVEALDRFGEQGPPGNDGLHLVFQTNRLTRRLLVKSSGGSRGLLLMQVFCISKQAMYFMIFNAGRQHTFKTSSYCSFRLSWSRKNHVVKSYSQQPRRKKSCRDRQ